MFPANSPPYNATSPPASNRNLTSAAAAAAALKRSSQVNQRRQSGSSSMGVATPSALGGQSRQGSVETERESSIPQATGAADEAGEDQDNEANKGNGDAAGAGPSGSQAQDAEAEDEDENKDELLAADMDAFMQAQMEKQKEDMKLLLENFSSDQLQRYEGYRRSALNRTNVRRLVSQVLNQQCSQTMAIVVAGFSKVYVGEIVEKAREVMEEWGQTGAIRPEHLREAHRRYKHEQSAASKIGRKLTIMR